MSRQSANNWLRFDIYSDGSSTRIFAASVVNGSPSTKISKVITTASPIYLNVERTGTTWSLSYSYNGASWTLAGSFTHALAVTAVGPYAGNYSSGGNAPAHTAIVDYFFNGSSPIIPEDGAAVATQTFLSITVDGSGSVEVNPDQTVYQCGDVVTLTAVAEPGFRFTEWNGDLNGNESPAVITMNSDKSIEAVFDLDTTPPIIGDIQVNTDMTTAIITWTTDEPANSLLEYGEDTGYALGFDEDPDLKSSHSVSLTGLYPGVQYHYRITAEDISGFSSTTPDRTFTTQSQSSGAPSISIWYGNEQDFGSIGNPQRWVNILGNVSDPDGISWLKYSLNGGSEVSLSMGPSNYRLNKPGDFNVEIATSVLIDGENQIVIRAADGLGNEAVETVVLNYVRGRVWPETYSVDWGTVATIQDVAQVVDGLWTLEGDTVRVVEPAYDRLIAIGDVNWSNYEVTVEMTAHSLLPSSNPPALGILVRWQGHVADGNQPSLQWWPLGLFAHYRWYETVPQLRMLATQTSTIASTSNFQFDLNVPYKMKLRSETVSGNSTYRLKVWRAGETEPLDWTLTGQETAEDQALGSLLLVAHNVDASFGKVEVTPIF